MVRVKQQKAMKHKLLENSKCHLPELLPELVMILARLHYTARRQDMPYKALGSLECKTRLYFFAATRIGGSPDHDLGDAEVVCCLLDISGLAFYMHSIWFLYAFYMHPFHSLDSFGSFHSFHIISFISCHLGLLSFY